MHETADRSVVRAWSPDVPGVDEVFHAHFVGHRYPPHCHDTWTLLVVDRGAIRYDLDGRERGAAGDLVTVLPPGVVHDGGPGRHDVFDKKVVYLDDRHLPTDLVDAAVSTSSITDRTLRRAIDRLHGALGHDGDQLDAEAQLTVIAERVRSHLLGRPVGAPADRGTAHRLREHLDAHLRTPITLDAAALDLDRHPGHLTRSFSAAFGVSPHAYVIGRRIELARRELLADRRIADVAVEVGFHDQAHLTRHFKRHVGVTPGAYARSVQA